MIKVVKFLGKLLCYIGSNYIKDLDGRRILIGHVFILYGSVIS